jgi:hypothetical protein
MKLRIGLDGPMRSGNERDAKELGLKTTSRRVLALASKRLATGRKVRCGSIVLQNSVG